MEEVRSLGSIVSAAAQGGGSRGTVRANAAGNIGAMATPTYHEAAKAVGVLRTITRPTFNDLNLLLRVCTSVRASSLKVGESSLARVHFLHLILITSDR